MVKHDRVAKRLFIAVNIDDHTRGEIGRISAAIRERLGSAKASWVKADRMHLTLHFFGDADAVLEERIRTALDAPIRQQPFDLAFDGLGTFPERGVPRVLWLGMLQGAEPMRLLASALDSALVKHGFDAAEQAFEPHLTVGRVRTPGDWTTRLIDAPTVEARFSVDRLRLVQSSLGAGGSRYETVAEAELAG